MNQSTIRNKQFYSSQWFILIIAMFFSRFLRLFCVR